MNRHIHIHVHDRRHKDKKAPPYYIDVPEGADYQIGGTYSFGGTTGGYHKGKVIGKRKGMFSGRTQVLVEFEDEANAKP